MKKIVSILLVLAMMSALCITVFAAELSSGVTGDKTGTVSVSVNKNPAATDVYDVTIEWNTLAFTYNATAWNSESGAYTGTWANGGTSTIDITNKSNAAVAVSASINGENAATVNGVTATLTNNSFSLASAAAAGAPTTGSVNIAVTGAPKADSITVGTITVEISK